MRPLNSINGRPAGFGYCISLVCGGNGGGNNPADSTTYFFGADTETMLHTVYANTSIQIPRGGTIKAFFLTVVKNVAGSNEPIPHFIRVNDVTDYSLGNMTWTNTVDKLYLQNLQIPVAAGDLIALKINAPAWVTNPTGVRAGGWVYIE
jgi:hypothetical protein